MVGTEVWVSVGILLVGAAGLAVRLYRGSQNGQKSEQTAEAVNTEVFQKSVAQGETVIVDQSATLEDEDGRRDGSEDELRENAERRLYEDGRLAEAVMYARQLAERQDLEEEADWLRWEQFGLRDRVAPGVEHRWEEEAPYRLIEVTIILPPEMTNGTPEFVSDWEIFWGRPIGHVEERLNRLRGGDELLRASMPLEDVVPPGSDPYESYPGDQAHFIVPQEALEEIVMGVRDAVARFLDEH